MNAVPAGPTPAFPEGEWRVPLEIVLALSRSAYVSFIRRNRTGSEFARPNARLFLRGKRFFAEVSFHGGRRHDLLLPLEVWASENA